jgi:TetR/AcrR family transcriptional regulator, ethionamide resistance regulator
LWGVEARQTVGEERRARRRHRPEEAERIILAAARSFLEERPFREMTVEGVMSRTGLSRPAFYAYFKDRYELVTRLVEGVWGLLLALDRRWLAGEPEAGREKAAEALASALRDSAETFVRYGPLLRAVADAAGQDPRVEEVYREGLIGGMIQAVAGRIERDIAAGNTPNSLDARETARALVLLTERYLLDAFGQGASSGGPSGKPSRAALKGMAKTLEAVWVSTLYGANDGS